MVLRTCLVAVHEKNRVRTIIDGPKIIPLAFALRRVLMVFDHLL
jgi:hypothetical protein